MKTDSAALILALLDKEADRHARRARCRLPVNPAHQRSTSGDGERDAWLTRQMTFEPLGASDCSPDDLV